MNYTALFQINEVEHEEHEVKLDAEVIERLRNPQEDSEPIDISDPDIRLSLDLFMACEDDLQKTYSDIRKSVLHQYPNLNVLTYRSVKDLVANLNISRVVSVSKF